MPTPENIEIFTAAYRRYYAQCVHFALSYTHDKSEAEDIAAETMLTLWLKLSHGEEVRLMLPFLMSITRNKILQYYRNKLHKMQAAEDMRSNMCAEMEMRINSLMECNPYQIYFTDISEILEESLKEMSPQTREIFKMSREHAMSNSEIAKAMNVGIKSVEYHITRALKKIRRNLDDYKH